MRVVPWLVVAFTACGGHTGGPADDRCARTCASSDDCGSSEWCSPVDSFCHPQNQAPTTCEPLTCSADAECTTATGVTGTCYCGLCTYAEPTCALGRRYTASGAAEFSTTCIDGAVSLSSTAFHTCVVTARREVQCWGQNCAGQLGNHDDSGCDFSVMPPSLTFSTVPTTVREALDGPPLEDAIAVSTGASHTCAVKTDGSVWCWGDNAQGQLGDGTVLKSLAPTQVIDGAGMPLANIVSITSGFFFNCAVDVNADVWCWGDNKYGQIGAGMIDVDAPAAIKVRSAYQSVAAGAHFVCARTVAIGGQASTERLDCWGRDQLGQLGDNGACGHLNNCADTTAPRRVLFSPDAPNGTATCTALGCTNANGVAIVTTGITELAAPFVMEAGNHHICASTRFPDAVACWGQNERGANGAGADGVTRFIGAKVALPPAPGLIIDVAAGSDFACALTDARKLYCWGGNMFGQLATGAIDVQVPVPTNTVDGLESVTAGFNHVCGIQQGRVTCWGQNAQGQLGDGTATDRTAPSETMLAVCPAR